MCGRSAGQAAAPRCPMSQKAWSAQCLKWCIVTRARAPRHRSTGSRSWRRAAAPTRCTRTKAAGRARSVVLVGENMHRHPMSITSLGCEVSELVNSDTCPRPTTGPREDGGRHLGLHGCEPLAERHPVRGAFGVVQCSLKRCIWGGSVQFKAVRLGRFSVV